ncbi:disease resistance protein At4g27190-like isoform X2 [Hevea brasiliensis]|nr:disease resistance protein At4g27190-like isoform X2 [Hevea brasiliensis]
MGEIVWLLSAICTPITNCGLKICPFIKQERDHAKKLDENRRRLRRAAERLSARKDDIEHEIMNKRITKTTTREWEAWVNGVEEIGEEVKILEAKYRKSRRFHYITCAFQSRAKLSRDMETKAEEIDSFTNQMSSDKAMVDREPVAPASHSFRKKEELSWVKNNVDRILDSLGQEKMKKIGVFAFAGMGKSTIFESLYDRSRESGLFHHVIFVKVEENDREEKIRQSILEQLNLKLNVGEIRTAHRIAHTISTALHNRKYLLMLDQVSEEIDLKELGIYDSHSDGKVVVATRYKSVCDNMNMDDSWELEHMSERDALVLFRQIAGEAADYERNKHEAKRIVKECGGMPLLINAVATYLKSEENDEVWSDCLWKLQSSTYDDDLGPFSESYNVFKLVYDRLNDYRKKCFLYGALYPLDHQIYEDHLIECWRAEQFIPATEGSNTGQVFRRARHEGHATIRCLINACLLKRCRKVKYVTIPYLFRNWALKTGEGVSSLVIPSNGMGMCQDPKWISLKCNDLSSSLPRVSYHMVTTLFLQRNEGLDLEQIRDHIFVLKSRLRVLDLGYTGIKSLPSSISNLINLKALYLNNCSELGELPAKIKKLKSIEILDICQTGISHWPDEIGDMTGLRCLRVSFVRNVGNHHHNEVQPWKIIARLPSLEELTIVVDEVYQNQWNGIFLDEKWNNVAQEIAEEVAKLKFLTTLHIYFPSVKCLDAFIRESKSWNEKDGQWGEKTFRSFKITVGSFSRHYEIDMNEHKAERHLKFFAYNELSDFHGSLSTISEVLKQACTFELIGHKTIEDLSGFGINNMAGLKVCAIKDCNQMKTIISGNNEEDAALKELKQLHLINLSKLTSICEGLMGEESFASLTTLIISNCHELSVILSIKMIQRITLLEHLRVENCSKTTDIIGVSEQDGNNPTPSLPRLKSLQLVNLSILQNFCQNVTLNGPSLRAMEIDQCWMLQNLPLSLNNTENLRLIKCHESWWNQLNLEPHTRSRYQAFCHFI